jgi:hypothetical protein
MAPAPSLSPIAQRIDWFRRLMRLILGKHPFLGEARAKELFADIEWDEAARERLQERNSPVGQLKEMARRFGRLFVVPGAKG